jgi:hypothetical protein
MTISTSLTAICKIYVASDDSDHDNVTFNNADGGVCSSFDTINRNNVSSNDDTNSIPSNDNI